MKKMLTILAAILAMNIFGGFSTADAAVAVGKSPTNISNPMQAKLLARRAAKIITIKNNGGQAPQVISEIWNSSTGEYIIQY